jgi:hypothetical protein
MQQQRGSIRVVQSRAIATAMCGRHTNSRSNAGAVRERFGLAKVMSLADFQRGLGRANISPTQSVLAVVQVIGSAF